MCTLRWAIKSTLFMKTFEVISEERLKALFQIEGHATCNWLHDLIENCISELKCLALK